MKKISNSIRKSSQFDFDIIFFVAQMVVVRSECRNSREIALKHFLFIDFKFLSDKFIL